MRKNGFCSLGHQIVNYAIILPLQLLIKMIVKLLTLAKHSKKYVMKTNPKNPKAMKTRTTRITRQVTPLIILIVMLTASISCDGIIPPPPAQRVSAEVQQQVEKCDKVRGNGPAKSIAFLYDRSGSAELYGIPELQPADLNPAINYIRKNGGSVMFGIIFARSDYRTVQLSIDPAKRPVKPLKPKPDDFKTNSFDYDAARRNYYKELIAYASRCKEYEEEVDKQIERFKNAVREILEQNVEDYTDIGNAVIRANHFHAHAIGNEHYTLLISDGEDLKGTKVPPPGFPVKCYLVYGKNKPDGPWVETCQPIIVPDLNTAYRLIEIQ